VANITYKELELDIKALLEFTMATSAAFQAASTGLVLVGAASIGAEGVVIGGLAAAFAPAALLTGALVLAIAVLLVILGGWSREKVIDAFIVESYKNFSSNM